MMKFLKKITAKFGYIDRLNRDLTNDIEGTIKLAIKGASQEFQNKLDEAHKKRKLSESTMLAINELKHENVVDFNNTK
jgi:hypothetical protein